ncbi:MAG TPA: hypothetical protein DCE41_11125, partial [Cytophagales bacterium]|nr:hypothetical protein [Cytophagales bacterium]
MIIMGRFLSQATWATPPWLLHCLLGTVLYFVYYPIAGLPLAEVQLYQHLLMLVYSIGSLFLLYQGYRWITVGLDAFFPRKKTLGTRLWIDTLVILGVSQVLLWSGLVLVRLGACPFAEIPTGIQTSLWFFSVINLLVSIILAFGVQLWQLSRSVVPRGVAMLPTASGALAPHFLFNALSGLLDLLSKHPDSAQDYVHDLSELYAHLLRHRKRTLVSVAEELHFVQAYLRLVSRRCPEGIQTRIAPELAYCEAQIPPLVLHTLVENVVKHNPLSSENPILLEVYRADDQVTVKNSRSSQAAQCPPESFGIGTYFLKEQFNCAGTTVFPAVHETQDVYQVSIPLTYPDYANS